jgi:pimeloyl-ACP methyl ester carboxylesterase
MRDPRGAWAAKTCGMLALVLALIGLVVAQVQQPQRPARKARGQVRDQGGAPLQKEKARPNAADPLGKAAGAGPLVPGTYHFTFRLHAYDGAPLAASYYRSKAGSTAPVVLLIHESGRSRKDFDDPVQDLRGQGLAEHLQGLDYAVLSLDIRGQGQNPRRALGRGDRSRIIEDLQAAFFFLVDRHNRGELNLAKLGVIAVGDGANLAMAWAFQPGAAVTTEGHPSDLSALVLISPMPEGSGYQLRHVTPSLATRIPMLLLAGERDNASKDAIQGIRPLVERGRLNKIELYPSALHGYKLLRLEPKVTSTLFHFLDTSIKNRAVSWEPQYNLLPITFSDIQTVRHTRPDDAPKKQAADNKKAAEAEAQDAKAPPADAPPAEKEKAKSRRQRTQPDQGAES